jgi:hypothetical protein
MRNRKSLLPVVQSTDDGLLEQELKKIDFNCYKICNKTSKTLLKNSIILNTSSLLKSMTFLPKPLENKKYINKNILFTNIETLIFNY